MCWCFKLCWYLQPWPQLKGTSEGIVSEKGKPLWAHKECSCCSICQVSLSFHCSEHDTTIPPPYISRDAEGGGSELFLRSGAVAVPDSGYGSAEEGILPLDRGRSEVARNFLEAAFWFNLQMADW